MPSTNTVQPVVQRLDDHVDARHRTLRPQLRGDSAGTTGGRVFRRRYFLSECSNDTYGRFQSG